MNRVDGDRFVKDKARNKTTICVTRRDICSDVCAEAAVVTMGTLWVCVEEVCDGSVVRIVGTVNTEHC